MSDGTFVPPGGETTENEGETIFTGGPLFRYGASHRSKRTQFEHRLEESDNPLASLLLALMDLVQQRDEEEEMNDAMSIPADPQEAITEDAVLRRLAIRSSEVPPADPRLDPRYRNPRRTLRVSR